MRIGSADPRLAHVTAGRADTPDVQNRRHLRQDIGPALAAERDRLRGELYALRGRKGADVDAEERRLKLHLRWVLEKLAEIGEDQRQALP